MLALAKEDWHRADARGYYPSGVWERVFVSFYVYSDFVFGFVGNCSGDLSFFVLGWFLFWAGFFAFPCFASGLLALPLCGAAPTFLCLAKEK
ncbi:hypothetical protein P3T23_001270 [Paraburkholderia sp. GAS448]